MRTGFRTKVFNHQDSAITLLVSGQERQHDIPTADVTGIQNRLAIALDKEHDGPDTMICIKEGDTDP